MSDAERVVEQEDDRQAICPRIQKRVYRKTRAYCVEHGIRYEDWINRAMEKHLEYCLKEEGIESDGDDNESGTEKLFK